MNKKDSDLKIIYITRKYPPSIGGMQTQALGLSRYLPGPPLTIALGENQWNLWWFIPYAFIKGLFSGPADIVLAGDGLMSFVVFLVAKLTGRKSAAVIHGLDIVYPSFLYQLLVKTFLKGMDLVIAVSHSTKIEAVKRGIPKRKIKVIPNGIFPVPEDSIPDRDKSKNYIRKTLIEKKYDVPENAKFIVILGRIIPRKGQMWFANNVMPLLPENTFLILVGRKVLGNQHVNENVKERVLFLNCVDDVVRLTLLRGADLVLMPNIKIKGDMEGFGIAVLEAAAAGTRVLAAKVNGLRDAISNERNGKLVKAGDPEIWRDAIMEEFEKPEEELHRLGDKAANFTRQYFSWQVIGDIYGETLEHLE